MKSAERGVLSGYCLPGRGRPDVRCEHSSVRAAAGARRLRPRHIPFGLRRRRAASCHLVPSGQAAPGMPTRPVTVEGATRPRGRRGRSWRGRAASPALPGSQGRRAVGRGEHRRPQAARHRRPRCAPGSSAGGGDGEGRAHRRGRRVPRRLPRGVACRLAQRPVAGRRRLGGGRLPRCPPAAGKPVQMACGSWIVQHHETIAGNRIPDEGWPWGFRPT